MRGRANVSSRIKILGRLLESQNHCKRQERGFLGILQGTLGASMLGYMLTEKWVLSAVKGVTRVGKGVASAWREYGNMHDMDKIV